MYYREVGFFNRSAVQDLFYVKMMMSWALAFSGDIELYLKRFCGTLEILFIVDKLLGAVRWRESLEFLKITVSGMTWPTVMIFEN